MRSIRLFVELPLREGDRLALPENAVSHLVRVLRLGVGDSFILFNGDGREFAASLGFPMRALDYLMTSLIVFTVVLGLQFVGVVLMSALLVAPVVAARQWVDRLGVLCLLAGIIGGFAGFAGAVIGHQRSGLPAGPVVVLAVTAIVVASILFAPRRGLVWGSKKVRVTG